MVDELVRQYGAYIGDAMLHENEIMTTFKVLATVLDVMPVTIRR